MSKRTEISPYGYWKVTTEGDCEGKTIRQLGVHKGYVDEIAFALASQAGYGLQFSAVDPVTDVKRTPTATSVQVSFDTNTGTWDMTPKERKNYVASVLKDRPVRVEVGQCYACVMLVSENEKEMAERIEREKALNKLTKRERELLGLSVKH